MPIYEYECTTCLMHFELKRSFGDNGGGVCPGCGSHARRLFSPVPIVFKGSGFYVTDHRKESNRSTDEYKTESDGDKARSSEKAE